MNLKTENKKNGNQIFLLVATVIGFITDLVTLYGLAFGKFEIPRSFGFWVNPFVIGIITLPILTICTIALLLYLIPRMLNNNEDKNVIQPIRLVAGFIWIPLSLLWSLGFASYLFRYSGTNSPFGESYFIALLFLVIFIIILIPSMGVVCIPQWALNLSQFLKTNK